MNTKKVVMLSLVLLLAIIFVKLSSQVPATFTCYHQVHYQTGVIAYTQYFGLQTSFDRLLGRKVLRGYVHIKTNQLDNTTSTEIYPSEEFWFTPCWRGSYSYYQNKQRNEVTR